MAAGQALSVWAIGHLELTVAEPLLATSLVFALLLAMPLTGQRRAPVGAAGRAAAARRRRRPVGVPVGELGQACVIGSNQYWWAAAVVAAIAVLFLRGGLAALRPAAGHADRPGGGPGVRHLRRPDPA